MKEKTAAAKRRETIRAIVPRMATTNVVLPNARTHTPDICEMTRDSTIGLTPHLNDEDEDTAYRSLLTQN
jgi:hypothetical protein